MGPFRDRYGGAATGFEAWLPTEPDVAALKDAAKKLDDTLWADETGPAPPQRNLLDDSEMVSLDGMDGGNLEMEAALTSASALAAQPAQTTQVSMDVGATVNQLVYQPTVQNTFVKNDGETLSPGLRADFQRRGHRGAAHRPQLQLHYLDQHLKDYKNQAFNYHKNFQKFL